MPCEKKGYSKKGAETRLNQLREVKALPKRPQRVYHCPDCNRWHITSKGDYEEGKIDRI